MDLQLTGKRALISGSSSGIGAECARTLAREGVAVVVHGRDRERAEAVAKQITDAGGKAAVTIGDLEQDDEADRVAAEALDAFGGIDILVNNAGLLIRAENPDWTTVPMSDWMRSFSINILAAVRLSQKLAPGMIARGWGRIINFSSTAGHQSLGQLLEYGPAKASVHNFTINLSRMIAPNGRDGEHHRPRHDPDAGHRASHGFDGGPARLGRHPRGKREALLHRALSRSRSRAPASRARLPRR